jgi:hypothetical protein
VTLNAASGAVNNVIPVSRLNPVALKYLSLLPLSSDPCGKILYGVPSIDGEDQGVVKADWHRTDKDSVFVRYFITDYVLNAYYDKSNLLTAGTAGLLDRVQTAIVGDTYLINSRTISSFRASLAPPFSGSALTAFRTWPSSARTYTPRFRTTQARFPRAATSAAAPSRAGFTPMCRLSPRTSE